MKKPYLTQRQAINETLNHLDNGKTRIINVQFCGLGKTELGAWISKNIKGNVLFLVHKNTIVNQAIETYKEIINKSSFGLFTSEEKQTNKRFIFANVMTLCRNKNLFRFPRDYFKCIVIDECHHMVTPSYHKILEYFDNKFLLGFTATPHRFDKESVLDLFEEKVGFFDEEGNDISLRTGIEMGYLSPLRYFALKDNLDWEKIYHNGYRYNRSDCDRALIINKLSESRVNKWLEMAKGKKTICFCNSIKHANHMLKHFKNKGTHLAVERFESFLRKVSSNGKKINKPFNNNSIKGFVLKADIKHYFATMNHEVLINILRKNIKDKDFIGLINIILSNFDTKIKGQGVPLGNYTSQFLANVYLNRLDYFVKHRLKAKYYIRYVDDFVILDKDKKVLEEYLIKIKKYLKHLKIELHPDKSGIYPLRNGITFLGYRIFYHYKLLRKRNINHFFDRFKENIKLYQEGSMSREKLESFLQGWFGYSKFANTYNLRKKVRDLIPK